MNNSSSPSRISELDGLRGIAIGLVILCHYVGDAQHAPLGYWPHHLLSALSVGWSGVDLFFVLSGFLIGGILLDAREAPHFFRAFYMRRAHRILPIYYAWLFIFALLACLALWGFPGRFAVETKDLTQLPYYLLFLQNMKYDLTPFQWVWLSMMWSLAVEEQFYLLAPPLIRFLKLRTAILVLAATVCLAPVLRLLALRFLSEGSYIAPMVMPCRADALACGMLLAVGWRYAEFRAYLEKHRAGLRFTLLGLALGVLALIWWLAHPINVVTVTIGYTTLAAFYSCLLLVALTQTGGWIAGVMRWSPLRSLGKISYCVYVVHATIHQFAHRLLLADRPQIYNLAGVGVTLLAFVVTLIVASLSWRYFEDPLIRRGHKYSYWERPGRSDASRVVVDEVPSA